MTASTKPGNKPKHGRPYEAAPRLVQAPRVAVPDDDAIRRRAYEIWEREGRPAQRELQHWEQAVRELAASPAVSDERVPLGAPRGARKRAVAPEKKSAPKARSAPPSGWKS